MNRCSSDAGGSVAVGRARFCVSIDGMRPYLAVLLAALLFGTTGTSQALGGADASPASIGAARILIGGGALALIAAVILYRDHRASTAAGAGRFPGLATPARPAQSRSGRAYRRVVVPSWLVLVIGASGVLAYQPAFFAGTGENGVAVGTIVALGSAPIITGACDWALRRRFPGVIWLIATVLATIGVVLLSGLTGSGQTTITFQGILSSLAAGASYAVYTLSGKALLERGWSPTAAMGGEFGLAAALSIPLLAMTDTAWLLTPNGLLMALWLGLVTTTLAYVLFGWGLKKLTAPTVSTLTLAEPVTATVLGILLLGEQLTPASLVGLAVLAAGVAVLTIPMKYLTGELIQRRAP